MAYAGLDIGTSGCKIVVYDKEGNSIYQTAESYREYGSEGYRELDPNEVAEKILIVLKRTGEQCPFKIEALAAASLGESVVCLDEKDESLCRSMVTGDKRGIEECRRLKEKFSAEKIMEITGLPPSEMYGLPKYIWLNEHTDTIKKAEKILFYEDFSGYLLTGKRVVSYSSASRSMAFDIKKKAWDETLLSLAGIRVSQMSVPAGAGTVIGTIRPEIARRTGLNPEMKVVVGGHDQSCAAFGSGLDSSEVGECGMGTCEFMFMMLPKIQDAEYMIANDFTCVPYGLGEKFLTSLEVTTCGVLKNWCRSTFLNEIEKKCEDEGCDFWGCMDEKIQKLETDVLVLPQFGSSGNPDINYDVKGTITGLTVHTRPEEIYLAVLEGIAFQMKLAYEKLEKTGVDIRKIVCTGGGAKSDVTLQIRADIFDMEITTVQSKETGTLGCMMLAAVGNGEYASLADAVKNVVRTDKSFIPDVSKRNYYETKYKKFKELYESMHLF